MCFQAACSVSEPQTQLSYYPQLLFSFLLCKMFYITVFIISPWNFYSSLDHRVGENKEKSYVNTKKQTKLVYSLTMIVMSMSPEGYVYKKQLWKWKIASQLKNNLKHSQGLCMYQKAIQNQQRGRTFHSSSAHSSLFKACYVMSTAKIYESCNSSIQCWQL